MEIKGRENLHKIVVLNPKGGSGKTTLAFNLAGYLATTGRRVAVIDMDHQGSSMRWLHNRSSELPKVVGISVRDLGHDAITNRCIAVPEDIEYVVVDAPAGLRGDRLIDYTCGAHAIFVPVLPSDLDIHSASRLISDLLLKAQVSRRNGRLGVVANRIKEHTIAYRQLRRFLSRLSITVVGHLRDSQNYARAAQNGFCIHEMPPSRARKDLEQWDAITKWLESRLASPLTSRDLLRPVEGAMPRRQRPLRAVAPIPIAAAVATIGLFMWLLSAMLSSPDSQPVDQVATMEIEPGASTELVVTAPPEMSAAASAGKKLNEKWQLNGVARRDGSSVLILRDRVEDVSRRLNDGADLDGWVVTDSGADYAVFAQNGEEVRLLLNEDIGR